MDVLHMVQVQISFHEGSFHLSSSINEVYLIIAELSNKFLQEHVSFVAIEEPIELWGIHADSSGVGDDHHRKPTYTAFGRESYIKQPLSGLRVHA